MGLLSNNLDKLSRQFGLEKQSSAMGLGRVMKGFMGNTRMGALRNNRIEALRKALNRGNPRWSALRLNRPIPAVNSYPIPNMYTRSGILGIY